jgi:hypothetical protein
MNSDCQTENGLSKHPSSCTAKQNFQYILEYFLLDIGASNVERKKIISAVAKIQLFSSVRRVDLFSDVYTTVVVRVTQRSMYGQPRISEVHPNSLPMVSSTEGG